MRKIFSVYGNDYAPKEPNYNSFLEKLYKTFDKFYNSKDNTVTLNELKKEDMMTVLPDLEQMCAMKSEPKYISIIENSEIKKLRIYTLTASGMDFFDGVKKHNERLGYKNYEELKADFKLSLELEYKGLIKPDVIDLYKKLNDIEEKRGMNKRR